jgi:hypothetical protein
MEQRFCAALEARGEALVRTGKYRVYSRTKGMPLSARPTFYYVGASGGLRIGFAAVGSLPANRKFKDVLLAEGSEELGRRAQAARDSKASARAAQKEDATR